MPPLRPAVTGLALAAALGLQACTPDAGPLRGTLASPAGRAGAPEFVAASRPATLDYIPVGTTGSERATQPRSAADAAAAEAELEALRARNEAQGAAVRRAAGASPAPRIPSSTQP